MTNESKKVPCKNKDCNRLILELTAKKTGGYCYPCYNAIEAAKRDEYIRKNRKDVNLYEGINDPVEIIKIMHKEQPYNPLIRYIKYPKTKEQVYAMLTNDDIERLKKYAMELYKSGDDQWEMILLHLVCVKNAEINEFLKVLIRDGKIYEPSLFKNACDEIAELLIEKLKCHDDNVSINHILLALAMIGNERVVKLFNEWKENKKYICLDNNEKTENYSSNEFLDVKFTKIGGMPTWIQYAHYPKCPKCGEEMKFIGQLSGQDLDDYAEGIYYGFI